MTAVQESTRPTFWSRVLASLVDYLLILGWMLALAVTVALLWLLTGKIYNWLELGPGGAQLLGFVVLVLPVGVYLYLSESSAAQATLGKRRMQLQVLDGRTGQRASKPQILLRTVVKLLPWEIAHFSAWRFVAIATTGSSKFPAWLHTLAVVADLLPVIYLLMVGFQREGRGLHDLAAGTKVVRLRPAPAELLPERR